MCAPEQADDPVPMQGGMQRHNHYGQMRQETMQKAPCTVFEDCNPQKRHSFARDGDATVDEQFKVIKLYLTITEVNIIKIIYNYNKF